MNELIKVARYKIDIQKSIVFIQLFTYSDEHSKNKIKGTISHVMVFKRIKYLGINLTKISVRHIHQNDKVIKRN